MFIMVKSSTKYVYKGVPDVSATQIKLTDPVYLGLFYKQCREYLTNVGSVTVSSPVIIP